jgi:chromosome partitioning protein
MIPIKDAAEAVGLSVVRMKQILKENALPHDRASNRYITVSHDVIRQVMKIKDVGYKHKVATFGIEKGGTGKSTMTLLFALFASRVRGAKVAIIDLDPEASATHFLMPNGFDLTKSGTILEVFEHNRQIIELLQPSRFEGIDFLASRAWARRVDRFVTNSNPKTFLRQKMNGLSEMYDIVLFDVPPSFSQMIAGAYLSSDMVFCVVNSDVFSLESLTLTKEDIIDMSDKFEAKRPAIRILRNRFSDQRRNARETHVELQRDFPDELLPFQVKESATIANAINDGVSPFEGRNSGELRSVFSDIFNALMKPSEANA